jgi:hypothetical protein
MMAWITADPLIQQQLTASGFVVMKGQPAAAPLPSHHPAHRGLRTRFNGQKHSALAGLKRADNWGKGPLYHPRRYGGPLDYILRKLCAPKTLGHEKLPIAD